MNIDIVPLQKKLNVPASSTMLEETILPVTDIHTGPSTLMNINLNPLKEEFNVTENSLSIWEKIKNLHLPDKWTSMVFCNSVVVGIWKPDGCPAKRLVVKPDLTIQVRKLFFTNLTNFDSNVLSIFFVSTLHKPK